MLDLLEISTIYYLFHVMILNAILCEYRYPRKKAIMLTVIFLTPLAIYNGWFFVHFGSEFAGQMVVFNCTIPSLIFFWIVTKHRNGRILFTFCLSDTVSLEIVYITRFIDDLLGVPGYYVLFILRLVAWPILEYSIIKHLRTPYLRIQNIIEKGWGGFAAITLLFYILLLLMAAYPFIITERLEYMPALLLVMTLMPLIYWCIMKVLVHQQEFYQIKEEEQLLLMQSAMMKQRIEQFNHAETALAIQRHDLRHRFHTLDAMLSRGDITTAREYIASSDEALAETRVKRWCANPVLDAVFASFFSLAEERGIKIEATLDIPEDIHVDATELSTVFANALENAINAVSQLPLEERIIRCKCIRYPSLILRVSNPYHGKIIFDSEGRPVPQEKADFMKTFKNFTDSDSYSVIKDMPSTIHGLGTRSITAYCEKHGAYCEYTAENGWFTVSVIQP